MNEKNPGQGPADVADPDKEAPEEQEPESPGSEKEVEKPKSQKDHEPPPESPRFKEVYGNMKRYERALEEKDKDIEAMRAAMRQQATRLEEIERTKADKRQDPPPDPAIDPDGYKKWHEHELAKKDREHQQKSVQERLQMQIDLQMELHDDYAQMVGIAERDAARDPKIQKEIWGSDNPAKKAYQYGKRKMDELKKQEQEVEEKAKSEEDRQKRLQQGAVEGGGFAPSAKKEEAVSDDERRVIRNLFPNLPYKEAEKQYLANRKHYGR